MAFKTDFIHSTESEPHRIRTKKILKEFPEVRDLIGKNPLTMVAIIAMVGSMIGVAW
ncbi:MAG TPA: fatty acid desaturase, partial [Mucilaginibacter sp.]|nr:fatty acid desaturase [Mucilaginibacter sp.]